MGVPDQSAKKNVSERNWEKKETMKRQTSALATNEGGASRVRGGDVSKRTLTDAHAGIQIVATTTDGAG